MENIEGMLKNEEPFDPDKAFKKMLELNDKATELSHSDQVDAFKELKEIVKEITRLAKLRKDFYEEQLAELKKKKDNN
jgi:cytochrome c556